MKKQILAVMLVLSFILTGCMKKDKEIIIAVPDDSEKSEEKLDVKGGKPISTETSEETKEEGEVKMKNYYKNENFGLALILPNTWEGNYTTKEIENEDYDTVGFYYNDSEGNQSMLMLINMYPSSKSVYEIEMMPNNEIIARDYNYTYTASQVLDMPYKEKSKDFEKYSGMLSDIDDILENISSEDKSFVHHKKISEYSEEKNYTIEVSYPLLNRETKINSEISKEMKERVKSFKDNLLDPEEDIAEGSTNGLRIDYEITQVDDEIFSVKYTASMYMAGAAHPNNYTFSMNYNWKENKEIQLSDLFSVSEKEYLEKISELVLAELELEFIERGVDSESDMVKEGTMPELKNYNNYNLKEDGIQFNFNPYVLAPYAVGEFNVFVSYNDLSDILKK